MWKAPIPRYDGSIAKKRGRRPKSVIDAKQLALTFATAVTVPSSDRSHYVARKGKDSPFYALQAMLPEVGDKIPIYRAT